ncbi:MAG: hypothetical protein AB1894_02375 [Chloroflexota bacterium]
MHRNKIQLKQILAGVLILAGLLLAACSPTQAQLDAHATQVAAEIYTTQTVSAFTQAAQLAVGSQTPTPLPPTATPVPTEPVPPTPSATPRNPTEVAALSVLPSVTPGVPSLSQAAITLQDLPAGFVLVPSSENLAEKALAQQLLFQSMPIEASFTYLNSSNYELIFGFIARLPSPVEQATFDALLLYPEFMFQAVGAERVEGWQNTTIPGLAGIGDVSYGWTARYIQQANPFIIDAIAFRRGVAGVFVYIMYSQNRPIPVPVQQIASLMDQRVKQVLGIP